MACRNAFSLLISWEDPDILDKYRRLFPNLIDGIPGFNLLIRVLIFF